MINRNFNGMGQPDILQQFTQFKNQFTGDPRQQIQQMLNSGKVTQEQYNQAVRRANALKGMLGIG